MCPDSGASSVHPTRLQANRSYVDVVCSRSPDPTLSVLASLRMEIAVLGDKINVLSEYFGVFLKKHEVNNHGKTESVGFQSRLSYEDDVTLVENTAVSKDVECLVAPIPVRENDDDGKVTEGGNNNGTNSDVKGEVDSKANNAGHEPDHEDEEDSSDAFFADRKLEHADEEDGHDAIINSPEPKNAVIHEVEMNVVVYHVVADSSTTKVNTPACASGVVVRSHSSGKDVRSTDSLFPTLASALHTFPPDNVTKTCESANGQLLESVRVKDSMMAVSKTVDISEVVVVSEEVADTSCTNNDVIGGPGTGSRPARCIGARWQSTWKRVRIRNEEEVCSAWKGITDITRTANRRAKTVVTEEPSLPTTVNLSEDDCGDFIPPFMHSDVPGITNVIIIEQERDIANGVSAGYPEFLAKIEVGADSLASWLCKVESCVLGSPKSSVKKFGRQFQMEGFSFHGLTLWTALVPLPDIKASNFLFPCWKRLIGRSLLDFLIKADIDVSEQWFEDRPPHLSEIFGKARWQFP